MGRDNRRSVVDLLADLVSYDTTNPPGNEAELVNHVIDRLERSSITYDIETQEIESNRPNLIARAGDPTRGSLLLTGHTDVVPATSKDWTHDPFTLNREGNRLIGRGVSDMKGSLAAKIVAAESYLSQTENPGLVVLAFVADEEKGGYGTQALVDRSLDVDAAILGEATDMGVGIAHKGAARYTLTVHGQSAHSGRPDKGVNAINKLWRVIEAIELFDDQLKEESHPLLDPGSSITVTEVNGGIAHNVVPEHATCTVDWRFHPRMETDPHSLDERLEAALCEATMNGRPIDVDVDRWAYGRAVETDSDEDIVTTLQRAATQQGLSGDLVGLNAGTDARYLVHNAGIPTVIFGPGSFEGDAHTVDESIRIENLETTVAVYENALFEFFGDPS